MLLFVRSMHGSRLWSRSCVIFVRVQMHKATCKPMRSTSRRKEIVSIDTSIGANQLRRFREDVKCLCSSMNINAAPRNIDENDTNFCKNREL